MDFKPEATLKTNLCKIEEVIILTVEGRLDTANTNEFNAPHPTSIKRSKS